MLCYTFRPLSFSRSLSLVFTVLLTAALSFGSATADSRKRHFTQDAFSQEYAHHTSKKKVTGKSRKNRVRKSAGRISTPYELYVKVDISRQRMFVYKGGRLTNTWKVSTGTKSYPTPKGKFGANRMYPMFYATNWNRAEMPYSIFFKGAYAIHGTKSVSKLGRPASHGCVRLNRSNARKLYNWVKKAGTDKFRIEIKA